MKIIKTSNIDSEGLDSIKPKKLIIMRGISGSGKSTLAKKIQSEQGGQIFSTDEFFMQDGKYNFDSKKLSQAHQWNQNRVLEAMKSGMSPIIVDNTNTRFYEMKLYAVYARQNGYEVEFVESDTPWKFNPEELAKKNTHGVPLDTIKNMVNRYEKDPTVDKVLKSKAPWEK